MRRYFWGSPIKLENEHAIEISGDVCHHIVKVCRHAVGERFELLDGEGHAVEVELIEIKKNMAIATVIGWRQLPAMEAPFIHLYVGFPKFSTFEWILEKSVELGIRSITPLFTEFSFIRTDKKISVGKWVRFEKIIKAATEQCGRADLLQLNRPAEYAEVIGDEKRTTEPMLMGALVDNHEARWPEFVSAGASDIHFFVGSEGGFSASEESEFPGKKISLGPLVLRCETACIYLAAVLKNQIESSKG